MGTRGGRRWRWVGPLLAAALAAETATGGSPLREPDPADVTATGAGPWIALEPGRLTVLEAAGERVTVTALPETRRVGPYRARVVEEREWRNGRLVEVSWNLLAIVRSTGDVLYLGEEVDRYRDGRVAGHEGSWLAFSDGARPGILVPGSPAPGTVFREEDAPGVAADRGEVLATDAVVTTPSGRYAGCLLVLETNPLEPHEVSIKAYAPGVGLVLDGPLRAVRAPSAAGAR